MCHLPGVRESVVIAKRDSDDEPRLIAYLAVDESAGTPIELRRALESRLPPQFVPAQIICLDDLPHSLNGKINRELLPDPVLIEQPRTSGMEPPSTPQGERLVEIWKDLLGISAVGARDSFFDLGGHSLLAVRMLQRVADELHATVRLRVFYQNPTIDAVERLIAGDEQVAARQFH